MTLLTRLEGSFLVQEQEAATRIKQLETHLRLIKHFAADYLDNTIIAAIHQLAKEGLEE